MQLSAWPELRRRSRSVRVNEKTIGVLTLAIYRDSRVRRDYRPILDSGRQALVRLVRKRTFGSQ